MHLALIAILLMQAFMVAQLHAALPSAIYQREHGYPSTTDVGILLVMKRQKRKDTGDYRPRPGPRPIG
ncbi:hypothetical protein AAVH_21440 [Aphelenchoides avenae]|nr:hypothetical protein AAVH_21440 [Aphelenchus avenae]